MANPPPWRELITASSVCRGREEIVGRGVKAAEILAHDGTVFSLPVIRLRKGFASPSGPRESTPQLHSRPSLR
jgi:hypothetical protein